MRSFFYSIKKTICYKIYILCFISFFSSHLIKSNDCLEKKISISIDSSIYYALNIIGDSIGYYFSYNAELFDADIRINIQFKNAKVRDVLNYIFSEQPMNYKVIGNQIVINKKDTLSVPSRILTNINELISITGKIRDKESKVPIPFATLGIIGKKNWTVCNSSGDFVLKIDSVTINDTIYVSCLGYKNRRIPLIDYLSYNEKDISLETDYISIQEVIIRKVNPLTLLNRVIENIENNYPVKPFLFTGFYREIIKKNNHPVSITEAVVDGYKASYINRNQTDQIRLIKGRKIVDDQRSDTVLLKFKAGMYNSMLLDVIKNPADFLDEKYFQDYKYTISDIILSNDKYTYVIDFDQNGKSPYAFYKGKIYVNYDNAAVLNVEFSLNNYGVKNASDFLIIKKPARMKISAIMAKYNVNYSIGEDSLYRVNYIRSETTFRIRRNRRFLSTTYNIISEIAFTSADDENTKRLANSEIAKRNDVFTEKVTTYDSEFWKDYSYIPPEKSLLDAVKDFNNKKR